MDLRNFKVIKIDAKKRKDIQSQSHYLNQTY